MLIFRICKTEFANKFHASGAANRWNGRNQFVLYASATRSLAALEQLANRANLDLNASYSVMVISIPDREDFYTSFTVNDLQSNWRSVAAYGRLQDLGSEWYFKNKSLILRVPSVLIPEENNFVINTRYRGFQDLVKLKSVEAFGWDDRFRDINK